MFKSRYKRNRELFIVVMRSKLLLLLPALLLAATFTGCDIINPSEPTPTYVRIDSFRFDEDDPNRTGSSSNKITAVWVYQDNDAIGVFDLPCSVPVIMDKRSRISIAPGVTYGGIKDYQALYPFYTFDSMTIDPSPGNVINLDANTGYISGLRMPYNEDFEIGNGFEEVYPNQVGDTSLTRVSGSNDVFEGGGSGYIYLDQTNSRAEVANSTAFRVRSGNAYIELNYKCNFSFLVGLRGSFSNDIDVYKYFHGINANEGWNKMYIDIEPYIAELGAEEYKVAIYAELPEGQANGYILLDNIKVVTF